MACQLPEAISKIEEILSKNGEGIASAMLSGVQINMLNEAKNNLQSAIEIRIARMQNNTNDTVDTDKEYKEETDKLNKRQLDTAIQRIEDEQVKREKLLASATKLKTYAEDKGISVADMKELIETNYASNKPRLVFYRKELNSKPDVVIKTIGWTDVDTDKDFRSEFKNKRPSAAKWADKEVAKFDVATQAISDGTNNSTAGFVKDFYGDKANTGTYTKDDVVYLSTNGNRTGRVVPVNNGVLQGSYKNIDKAIEAGAKFVADTSKHLASTGKYNVGEVELAEYLQSKGYTREDKAVYGLWSQGKSSTQTTKVSKPITADELKIEKALSSDIDAVETPEDATKEWLSKRIDTLGLPEEVVDSMKNNMTRLNGLPYNGTRERTIEINKKHDKLNQLLLNKLLTDEEKHLVEAMDELYTLNGKLDAAVMTYKVDTSYRDMIIKYLNLIKDVYGYPEALKLKPFLKDSATFSKNSDYINGYASYNNKAFQNQFKYKEFLFTERGYLTYVINDIANVISQSFTKSFTQLKKTDYDEQAKFLNLFINTINDAYNNNDNLISSQFAEEDSENDNKQLEPEIKYGSVVKYKPENGIEGYYVVRGFSSNGGLQLTDSEGKNFSGTPNVDKVKFVKQLDTKRYNNVDYIVDSNNRVYTQNGRVANSYENRLLNEFGINKQKQNENEIIKENKNTIKENKSVNKYELFPGVYANEDQENAIDDIKDWYKSNKSNTYLLKGRGGTGKTTIVGEVIKQLGIGNRRVVFSAFSNKAVKVLSNSNKDNEYKDSKYLTTAQILKLKPVRDAKTGKQKFVVDAYADEKLTSSDKIIVIDEASMLQNKQQKEIEAKAKSLGIKIIYMGDDVQLPPVDELDSNGVAVKEALVFDEHKKTGDVSELTKRMRQKVESPILPVTDVLANAVKNELDPNKIVFEQGTEIKNGDGVIFLNKNAGELDIMEMFLKDFKKDPEGTKFIHYNAADNPKTKSKNDIIRRELYGKDFNLPENKYMNGEQVIFDNGYFYQDERTGNNVSIDGATEAKVLESHIIKDKPISYFHGKQKRTIRLDVYSVTVQENDSNGVGYVHEIDIPFNINRLEEIIDLEKKDLGVYPGGLKDAFASISYSYVITSHKSQGSTYNNAYVDIGNIFGIKATDNDTKLKSAYVATSRPRHKLVLIGANTNGKTISVDEAIELAKEDSQAYNPQSEPEIKFELVKETTNEIKSNIKNNNGDIVGEIKIRPNSTIKDELYRSDIRVSKTKIPKKLLDSKIVMIDDVYIEDDFKRSGYGLKTIEKIKEEYNGSIIMLDAYPTQGNLSKNELIKFYEKSGFKVLEKLNDDTVTFMYADLTGTDVGNNFVYKTISKDDIEAAKDIMSNNKKECE